MGGLAMKDIREGDLYKTVVIGGVTFEIRYGYTSEEERERWDPAPVYPDFAASPMCTADGYPFATVYQDGCSHFYPNPMTTGEKWCSDCKHFEKCEEYIGICRCEKKSRADAPSVQRIEMRNSIASAELAEA